jgi:hypothetical protein
MADDFDKPSDTRRVDVDSPNRPNARRRRLLLSAGGVLPSVLTLSSGAMAAAASTCVRPPDTAPEQFTTQQDGWVRSLVRRGDQNQAMAYCVNADQSQCVDSFNGDHAGAGSQWMVADSGNSMTANDFAPVRIRNGRAYGLVYVNRDGSLASLDPNALDDPIPVTQSCWNSLMGRGVRLG